MKLKKLGVVLLIQKNSFEIQANKFRFPELRSILTKNVDLTCLKQATEETCVQTKDETGLNSCQWCQNSKISILSACLSIEDESKLPSGMFQCAGNDEGEEEEEVSPFSCIMNTDESSCHASVDEFGNQCNWCTNSQISWLSACLSTEEEAEIPPGLLTCDHQTTQVEEVQFPDLTCLSNVDEASCENAVDSNDLNCSWCDSPTMSWLQGCLTKMEAQYVTAAVSQYLDLTCTNSPTPSKKGPSPFACMSNTDEDSCHNALDEVGNQCNWCTNSQISWLSACLSTEEEAELPNGVLTCDNSNVKEMELPDLTCLSNMDEISCETAVDSKGLGCAWCDSQTYSWLQGCLSQDEAQMITSFTNDYIDLSCRETPAPPTIISFPDISCLGSLDKDKCTSTLDSQGEMCTWCENNYLSLCLTTEEAVSLPPNSFACGQQTIEKIEQPKIVPDLSCVKFTDVSSCTAGVDDTGAFCTWCQSPTMTWLSACLTKTEAAQMPPGMFTCNNSFEHNNIARIEKELPSIKDLKTKNMNYNTYSFLQGKKHTFRDAPVDPNFCDPSSPLSFSGYMDVSGSDYDNNGQDKHLFFWFFEKRQVEKMSNLKSKRVHDETVPLMVWLTGGPGCSSTLALFFENGPCSVNKDGTGTIPNPNGWNEVAHMLWLDQPAGVGFSYGKEDDKNEDMVGEDVYYFLQSFFKTHAEYLNNPLFIFGESYGGHYAPAIAHRIFTGNQNIPVDGSLLKINLSGLGVGNGLTNPKIQYQYYAEMAYNNSHHIQTVSELVYEGMKAAIPTCVSFIDHCESATMDITARFLCQTAIGYCNMALVVPYTSTGLNVYDIRKECGDSSLCYDFTNIETFLNTQSTRDALHVTDESYSWASCNMEVHSHFTVDWMQDISPMVSDLINNGIPTLIYAGDTDFICNYMGNRAWVLDLEWQFKEEFNEQEEQEWTGHGMVRSYDKFTFMQVYDAGHMVPYDQGKVSLDMVRGFVTNGKL